jgi:hypothetical protein
MLKTVKRTLPDSHKTVSSNPGAVQCSYVVIAGVNSHPVHHECTI